MLVGRRGEVRALRQALDASGIAVIVGPAGIGKTTLARYALRKGAFREAQGLASLSWSPFHPFDRVLHRRPPDGPEAVASALVAQNNSPLLLDDLQWADDASLEVVRLLAGRLAMLATVRTGTPRSSDALTTLEALGAQRTDLSVLSDADAATLVDELHPGLDPSQRAGLLASAAGSPLLIEQLLLGSDASPRLVSALIERRRALAPGAVEAMDRLAVLGRPCRADLVGSGADALVEAGIAVRGGDELAMAHALLSEVVVDQLGPDADRVRRDLAPLVGDAEAAHLFEQVGDRDQARSHALRAQRVTSSRRQRAVLLALAVRCADGLDLENRVRAARLFTSISEPAQARHLVAVEGRDQLAPVERGALRAVEAEAAWLAGDQEGTVTLLEGALGDLRGTNTSYEVAALAASTIVATFVNIDGKPALERAQEAVRLADELGVEQGYARTRLASVLLSGGLPGWKELLSEVIDQAGADDQDLRMTAVIALIQGCWLSGDPSLGQEVALAELARGPRQSYDVTWLTIASYGALLGLFCGRPRSELVEEFTPFLESWGEFRSRGFMEAAVVVSLADQGDPVAALRRIGSAPWSPDPQWQAVQLWAKAEVAWLSGRVSALEACVAETLALGIGDHPAAIQTRLLGAQAAAWSGAAPAGPAPASDLRAWSPATVEFDGLMAVAEGNLELAVERLSAAADQWATCDVRSEARCRWTAGDAASRAGDPRAADILRTAERCAGEHGLVALAEKVRRSLRGAGVQRREPARHLGAGLTRREEQVLQLVGDGLRSAEIGAALSITGATVDSTIRSAKRKLGVSTRIAAAAAMLEQVSATDDAPTS